ncbi:MAG: YjbH domain-containing protein [Tannerellaceae bacterium]
MNHKRPMLLLAAIATLGTTPPSAHAQGSGLPDALENVRILSTDSVCYVQYTNNAWRNEAQALYAVLESMLSIAPQQAWNINIASDGIPRLTIEASQDQVQLAQSTQAITPQFIESLHISYNRPNSAIISKAPIHNKSFGKTDLVLYPQFAFQNNTFERIWETQFNLAPAIETSLWNGARITAQVIFPIHNNIVSPEARFIRPGVITLSQQYRLPHNIFGSISIGNFTSQRMGINLANYWISSTGIYKLGYTASLTGSSYVDRNGWSISKWKRLSAHLTCTITPQFYNMEAELSMGRYIYGDYGGQLTLTRRFNNAALQLFGRYTGGISCAGMSITVPIWLKKQSRAHLFRAKVSDWYQLSYSEKSGNKADHGTGKSFATSPAATPMTHYLNPYYLKGQLIRIAKP